MLATNIELYCEGLFSFNWRARGLCIARASERWRDCGVRASSCWARLERGRIKNFEAFKLESFQLTGRCHTGLGRGQARSPRPASAWSGAREFFHRLEEVFYKGPAQPEGFL